MDKTDGPFRHNTIPKGSMGCVMQHLHYVLNPPPLSIQQDVQYAQYDLQSTYDEHTILGYKSVRLHKFDSPMEAVHFFKNHFPCSRFVVNIQMNVTHELDSYEKNFKGTVKVANNKKEKADGCAEPTIQYAGPTIQELTQIRDFYISFANLIGDPYAKLIQFDEWKDDVGILNDVVDWLGYKHCAFNAISHDNENGYAVDNHTVIDVGEDCQYPFVHEK